MPLPKPRSGESRDDFVSRCMGDDSMRAEFPSQDQRAAVCYRQWRGKSEAGPVERKVLPIADAAIEVKADEGRPVAVAGYASTFGNLDRVGDVVSNGAYAGTIKAWQAKGWAMPMLFNHDGDKPIGKWVRMAEDAKGLHVEGELTPGHSTANDVAASLRHGAVSGLSIGYRTLDSDTDKSGVRLLKDLELIEVSIVTNPANELARVLGVKSADDVRTMRDFEHFLRDSGWSRRDAKIIAAKGFAGLLREEEGDGQDDCRDGGNKAGELLAVLRGLRSNLRPRASHD